ncbi:hypothetical protein [Olivibacter sitiensis]|uniref:hypothetical protein n=1 Tax=Olivibacter sitiensis TaxID=376470 RepID=UPI001B7FA216|nr:hypothetical protein [Olivibacter sitiensis]
MRTIHLFRNNSLLLLLLCVLFGTSCSKEENSSFNLNAEVQLNAFAIDGIEGDINQNTGEITIDVPFGTDITTLAPAFTLRSPERSSCRYCAQFYRHRSLPHYQW